MARNGTRHNDRRNISKEGGRSYHHPGSEMEVTASNCCLNGTIVVKRLDWVEGMKMDSVYGSIENENVLTLSLLKGMLTGGIRFPREWC